MAKKIGPVPRYLFNMPTRAGWHRHHLLPNCLRRYPDLRDFVGGLAACGLGMGDFQTNGMYLPAEETIARAERLPLHRGPHRTYNDIVIATLDDIRRGALATGIGQVGRVAAIRGLQRRLVDALRSSASEVEVVLGGRDPFGRGRVGAAIDSRTDTLFLEMIGHR